jgi:hypothetical protein
LIHLGSSHRRSEVKEVVGLGEIGDHRRSGGVRHLGEPSPSVEIEQFATDPGIANRGGDLREDRAGRFSVGFGDGEGAPIDIGDDDPPGFVARINSANARSGPSRC